MRKSFSLLKPPMVLIAANGLSLLAHAAPAKSAAPQSHPVKLTGPIASVNPMVGTAEHGHTYPGATVPFGMVQVSPDTRNGTWDGSSGYHYSDNSIRGFSHTHLSGTGCNGLGDILLMPKVGDVQFNAGEPGKSPGYASRFSHNNEQASPGYYKVFLDDPKITVELTATTRCGLQRYTFPATDEARIVLDLEHGIGHGVEKSGFTIEDNQTVSGYRLCDDWGGLRAVYFVMQFSMPFASSLIEQDGARLEPNIKKSDGKSAKAIFNYKTTANEVVMVKVGISGTSIEGARKNLTTEISGWDFNGVRNAAVKQWNEELGKVQIETPDPKIRRTFYTNLYQSLISPVLFNDVDGTYRGGDKKNHIGAKFQNYTTFSLWDTFRAQAPLLTILTPNRVPDMVNSMVALDRERGVNEMPVWPLWGNETGTMIGYNSAPVVVDAYLKGLKGFDPEEAYRALKATALDGRNGQDEYQKYGHVLSEGNTNQAVSRTLEFAFDDWCIAKMAEKLGHQEDAALFYRRAGNFMQVYDSTTGFMRGRKVDGSWRKPFNAIIPTWTDYTEATAWQYSWSVMQDIPKLVTISGGDDAFIKKMDAMFIANNDFVSSVSDITGLIGQYAHGNEPVHHVAYLYNYAGAPYKTQARVRNIMATLYNDGPAGDPGNNDCGQMSAWYVFSALGFYPVNPTSGQYVIGSPLIKKATIKLDRSIGGKTFTVVADNNSSQNVYIQSATLNGRPLNNSWFSHDQLLAGGTLHLKMGSTPNVTWGSAVTNRPHSNMPTDYVYQELPEPSKVVKTQWKVPIRVVTGSDEPIGNFQPAFDTEEGATNGNDKIIDVSAPNAAPAKLYQSERYGSDVSYSYPVPAGSYTVRLHFAEIFGVGPGQRLENIDINGKRVLTRLDIAGEAGENKALVKEFAGITPDANGKIIIRVKADPEARDKNAKISGIEILQF